MHVDFMHHWELLYIGFHAFWELLYIGFQPMNEAMTDDWSDGDHEFSVSMDY